MIDRGKATDKLLSEFYALSLDVKYGFAGYIGVWGRMKSPEYGVKKQRFYESLSTFARDCGIRCKVMDGENVFFVFTGKIYEAISVQDLKYVYKGWLNKVGITEAYASENRVFTECFLWTISIYSPLVIRNDLLAFMNKVVDFRLISQPTVYNFGPSHHVIDFLPYRYDSAARAPLFMSFLREVLPDKHQRDILQMFLGLGLIQFQTAYEANQGGKNEVELCLLLLGSGANGKSVLYKVISALFPHRVSTLSYEEMTAEGFEGSNHRNELRGAVFNWATDANVQTFGKKNTGEFKKIVSGEPYHSRRIGENTRSSGGKDEPPCPYLIFNLNQLPKLYEQDQGVLRRLQYVNFEKTIPRARQNPHLASDIIKNELSGVFNWVWRGAQEIRRRKFKFPTTTDSTKMKIMSTLECASVTSWTMAYGIRHDPGVEGEVSSEIKRTLMYGCYKLFCNDNGVERIVSESQFSNDMMKLHFRRVRKQDGIYYICYGIREKDLYQTVLVELIEDDVESTFDDPASLIKED